MIKIAIETWELYNNGILLCKWFDTDKHDINYIENYIKEATIEHGFNGNDIEIFIADYECGYATISEYDSLEYIYELASQMEALDDTELKQYEAMVNAGYDHKEALESYSDVEIYEDTTMQELAEQFVDDGLFGEINESIKYHIDYSSIARDLSMDYTEQDNDIVRVA